MTDVTPRPKSTGKRKRRNDLEVAADISPSITARPAHLTHTRTPQTRTGNQP